MIDIPEMIDVLKREIRVRTEDEHGNSLGECMLDDTDSGKAFLEDERTCRFALYTSDGDSIGMSRDASTLPLFYNSQVPNLYDALSRTLVMRRALNEQYSDEERDAAERVLETFERDAFFDVSWYPIVRRGHSLLQVFATGPVCAYHLLPVNNDEASVVPVIRDGKAAVAEFTGDEGGDSGAFGIVEHRQGRHQGQFSASPLYTRWIYSRELFEDTDAINDRIVTEVLDGERVWSRPPAGWA